MTFDLRLPIGALFTIYGVLLAGYGLLGDRAALCSRSLGLNINLGWGLVLLVFGVSFLVACARAGRRQ